MRFGYVILCICLSAVVAVPSGPERIIGGLPTTINAYPYASVLLFSWNSVNFAQSCAGTILNTRSLLSAAHCFMHNDPISRWRIRVGSSYASSGGVVHNVAQYINHPNFNQLAYMDNDVCIVRTLTTIVHDGNMVQSVAIAGPNYAVPDNAVVWAIGWGLTTVNGQPSEQLRHVQIWSVNSALCRQRYAEIGMSITDNMMCSGWLDVGGRDQCQQDSGGPLLHNNVQVGVCSWGAECALARYPGVNALVSRLSVWIQGNA